MRKFLTAQIILFFAFLGWQVWREPPLYQDGTVIKIEKIISVRDPGGYRLPTLYYSVMVNDGYKTLPAIIVLDSHDGPTDLRIGDLVLAVWDGYEYKTSHHSIRPTFASWL